MTESIVKALRTVHDPEIPVNVYDLGLIYDIAVDGGDVKITMTLTAPNCPMAETIVRDVETKVRAVDGVDDVDIDLVWEPKWSADMMSEAAKLELEFTGHTGPAHLRKDRFSNLTVRRTEGSAPMGEFVTVAKLSQIPPETARCVEVNGRRIGLFNLGGVVHAVDDVCPHADASLSDGDIVGTEVVCPLHFATFDLETGRCTGPPADGDLSTYTVRIDGDDIAVEVG